MDITRRNFVEALAIFKNYLPTATFVSIDLEFTGLGETRPSQLDTPAVRYETVRADAEPFPPIQFGLSIFRRRPELEQNGKGHSPSPDATEGPDAPAPSPPLPDMQESAPLKKQLEEPKESRPWQVMTFNFNIYPHSVYYPSHNRYPYYDRVVTLQSSSVHFLMEHGFDFMKIFTDGVSWVRQETEEALRKHIRAVLKNKCHPDQKPNVEVRKEDTKTVKFYREVIGDWIKEVNQEDVDMKAPNAAQKPRIKMFSMPKTRVQQRLVFDMIRIDYPRVFASSMATQEKNQLKVELYPTAEDAREKQVETVNREVEEELSKAVGFRYVIDALRESKIPLVVHNGIMDIGKLFANFVRPLPLDMNGFKDELLKAFPLIFDTRWMMQQVCDSDESVKKAIDVNRARSMDELVRTLQLVIGKHKRINAPDIRTFVPMGSIDQNGKHIGNAAFSEKEVGVEIHEGSRHLDFDNDVHGFGRYAASREGRFGHEAGFDALETGKLFVMLLHMIKEGGIDEKVDLASMELTSFRNKISLGSCGGYRCVDLISRRADEHNIYFKDGNAIVITGEWNGNESEERSGHPHRLRRSLLKRVIDGTRFDAGKSSIITAGPTTILAVLEKEKKEEKAVGDKRERDETSDIDQELSAVVENGNKIGVSVELYRDVVTRLPSDSMLDLKKRRCV